MWRCGLAGCVSRYTISKSKKIKNIEKMKKLLESEYTTNNY
jgi:hypothetical protein